MKKFFFLAALFGVTSCWGGLLTAYALDVPSGATIEEKLLSHNKNFVVYIFEQIKMKALLYIKKGDMCEPRTE